MKCGNVGINLKKAMQRTALLLALARTSSLVPEGGILRGRVHVVLEGDATPPPGDAVQVVLGTGETAAGGWGDGAHPSTALCLSPGLLLHLQHTRVASTTANGCQ